LNSKLIELPNIPHVSVPPGKSDADNEFMYEEGVIPELYDGALPHWELASKYKIIDFDLGSKVTGAGFPFIEVKEHDYKELLSTFSLMKLWIRGIWNTSLHYL